MAPAAPEPASDSPPPWPHCGHGSTSADPVGCRGIRVSVHTACLAHLSGVDRAAYLATLSPGTAIDHRGTPFTPELLDQLLSALRDASTGQPHVGDAQFDTASFSGDAQFGMVSFSGTAVFNKASFSGDAKFNDAVFAEDARFYRASFSGNAWFDGASFSNYALFNEASFSEGASFDGASFASLALFIKASFASDARFDDVPFSDTARFNRASFSSYAMFVGASFAEEALFNEVSFAGEARFTDASFARDARFDEASFSGTGLFDAVSFAGDARFGGARFSGNALFNRVRFEVASRLGPMVCAKQVVLDAAVFQQPVTLEIAARQVSCVRTRWTSTATLHLRYAELDLRDAVFEYPVPVTARATPFPLSSSADSISETVLSGRAPGVRLMSVDGVDAAHLALNDIDLSRCRFAGTVHLDQLRVDGWCTFATTPTGWSRRFPWRWNQRNTLAEEHHWRVRTARRPDLATALGWASPPPDAPVLRPAAVAALYRQLRKSLEDGKNEPDAADFYYGECEMRRRDTTRPRGERVLLTLYWALSGYGLRATRALAWLGAAITATMAVMMLWGLPVDDPKPTTTGRQVAIGQQITLTTDTPEPVNPANRLADRVTTKRFEKSLRVVINSVIFRSSGQGLTTIGTYTEMTSRLAEPVLLGLAALAVRSRVKR
ncbi:pentapeptide repeat-containing protein [Streptomyces sp. NPDC058326]|uniref:pentapeptide repeat-containing protein n=1 Tax=Streptomyces sp. NPDC058326 TaxID=3346447 RepID=UPI0036DFE998